MKAIDRLYQYFEYKGFKPTNFERKIGFSSGYLSSQRKKNADFGESMLIKIIDYCQDLSVEWLLLGKGDMIISKYEVKQVEVKEPDPSYKNIAEEISLLRKECNEKANRIIDQMDLIAKLNNELSSLKSADGAESRSA